MTASRSGKVWSWIEKMTRWYRAEVGKLRVRSGEKVCSVHSGDAITKSPGHRIVGEHECMEQRFVEDGFDTPQVFGIRCHAVVAHLDLEREVSLIGLQKEIDFFAVVGPEMVGGGRKGQAFDLFEHLRHHEAFKLMTGHAALFAQYRLQHTVVKEVEFWTLCQTFVHVSVPAWQHDGLVAEFKIVQVFLDGLHRYAYLL